MKEIEEKIRQAVKLMFKSNVDSDEYANQNEIEKINEMEFEGYWYIVFIPEEEEFCSIASYDAIYELSDTKPEDLPTMRKEIIGQVTLFEANNTTLKKEDVVKEVHENYKKYKKVEEMAKSVIDEMIAKTGKANNGKLFNYLEGPNEIVYNTETNELKHHDKTKTIGENEKVLWRTKGNEWWSKEEIRLTTLHSYSVIACTQKLVGNANKYRKI